MPAGEVGTDDVAHLAALHQIVERPQCLLDWRSGVEAVHGIDVHVIGLQTTQTVLAGADQMLPRRSDIVRVVAHAEGGLRGKDQSVAPSGNGLTEDLFRQPSGIDIRRVEEVCPRLQAQVNEPTRPLDIGVAPRTEESAFSAKRPRAEAQHGDLKARAAQ